LDEECAALDGVASRIERVPVDPDPTVIGAPGVYPDDPDRHRPVTGELDAGVRPDVDDVARR
jgi:hypothetical protein